ncbi:putative small auxin-up RNA [Medicago truncatula]|uniref:Putative small auxin-up RNA n=1 Tax=Medicago truncatula TaxID=3880 RepID=A0A072VKP3_MEDTR|nr:auxin-responsive protein SAUR32 [Medicago truncatula]KEH42201.1 SAUR-like auxin-responsive family protein [Medicago truncatula]RHN79754.1 putative small auxin-up RNA [Medicago truncatula]
MVLSFVGKIQKGISHFVHKRHDFSEELVPEDVREGYFAVVAMKDGETKKFIIGLEYLSDPEFLGLLGQAQEEYGFIQEGAIAVPCRPQELQNILDGQRLL